ncbi:hypothetical protein N0V93_002348 [Gnomoniopsis smithogilvyi]|uniref:Potassium transport protein n=1 Tax=Gnomoniopsis smithogilvyi TaxID=1191159 RepID=A0A9W8YWC6_9PEZI|nr:hypothetical protein N0V93_002348 [Gnomoniopsis smithogilvyi]
MARSRGWRLRWWTNLTIEHPRATQILRELRGFLPPLNFITLHYAYFIVVVLLTSVIFWGSSNPAHSISYTDSLFLTVSAMTEAGLNTVNLSQMTTWQQVLLFLLILFGGAIWVSIWTVAFRLHVFESRFEDIVKAEKARRTGSTLSLSFFRTATTNKATTATQDDRILVGMGSKLETNGSSQDADTGPTEVPDRRSTASLPTQGGTDEQNIEGPVGGHESHDRVPSPRSRITFADDPPHIGTRDARTTASVYANDNRTRRRNVENTESKEPEPGTANADMHRILTDKAGRNAQFHNLTTQEREQLGGYEYRALKLLSIVVPLYFALWQFLGCISLGAWIAYNKSEVTIANGLNPWWTGIFFGVSAFNNSGMGLLDANVIPFQDSYFVLIVMGAMILAGNTAYPIFLRFIFWSMAKVLSLTTAEDSFKDFKGTLQLILKYPRRVYTNMFPARQTWWLLFMVCLLNFMDWVSFEILNLGNPIIEAIPVGARVIDGLFQAIAVRSGGFYVVPISSVYIGLQILYVIMMYISVYPVVITMRHSNVYEERSLGIYADDPDLVTDPEHGKQPSNGLQRHGTNNSATSAQRRGQTKAAQISSAFKRHFALHGVGVAAQEDNADGRLSFIRQQIQGQVAHDIWFLVLAVLAISIIETRHFLDDPVTFSVFNVIFEVVSAYGTVGISTGLPNAAYSFSGAWYTGSKLVLCLVMLRGRHRGLPVALDRAVRLPGEHLHRDEEDDYRIRRSMTSRRMSVE